MANRILRALLFTLPQRFVLAVRRVRYGVLFQNRNVRIGANAKIVGAHYVSIEGSLATGSGFWLEAIDRFGNKTFAPQITIGDGFVCSDSVHIGCVNRIQIAKNVLIGSKALITDHTHGTYGSHDASAPTIAPFQRALHSSGPVVIKDNVFIGDNCVIQPGVTIGTGAVVAANSVVTRNVPDATMVAGAPAVPIKHYSPSLKGWVRVLSNQSAQVDTPAHLDRP